MNGELVLEFPDLWLWLIFIGAGLLLVLLELVIGVDTGFDLVIIGSVFILGGLLTWPFHTWPLTVIVTTVLSVIYVVLGRKYVHRWTQIKQARTNIDAIIDKRGIVLKGIARNSDGSVRVGNEQWRARAEEDISAGEEIIVTNVSGVTLIVEKSKGGI